MDNPKSWQKSLPPLILIGSLFAIYLRTLAPGLTWANEGSDGGDLIAAAATGGVAHPTGYPLFLLVARVFQFLPLGSLAFRTNLMSAIATILASLLVYEIVITSQWPSNACSTWLSGLAAGFAFGLAPLVWSQAVITEVYGLHVLLVALILYLYAKPTQDSASAQKLLDRWRGLILGLAIGNHMTAILMTPAALIVGSIYRKENAARGCLNHFRLDQHAFLRQLGMFAAGLSLYLILPVRALRNPPINWGTPITPARFWWLIAGQLYQSYYLQFNAAEWWARIQPSAALLLQQFGLLGIMLAVVGLIWFGTRSRLYLLTIWIAVVHMAFAAAYSSADSFVYLMPACLSFAVWVGLGVSGLINYFARWSSVLRVVFGLLLLGCLIGRSLTYFNQLDASMDARAESFVEEVLSAAPKDAILFAKGDRAIFALWYFHFALARRSDLAIVAEDLLHFDWYQENLRATYPSIIVPGPFPWPETLAIANPSRPVCYVQYEETTLMDCSPPVILH